MKPRRRTTVLPSDVRKVIVGEEDQQEDWSSGLDQEDLELPHIKEEQQDQEDPEPPHIKEEQQDQEDLELPHIKEEQQDQEDLELPLIKEEQQDQEDPEPPHIKEEQHDDWSCGLDQEDPELPHIKEEKQDQEDPEPPHIKEEQQDWSCGLDQEDPELPHIKEEQQEGEQPRGLEEADITKFLFTPVPVKSEDDDEEEAQSSQLHHMEADGEDCGGPGSAGNSHPDNMNEESSGCDTDDSDDWQETRDPQSALRTNEVPDLRRRTGEKPFSCSECPTTRHRASAPASAPASQAKRRRASASPPTPDSDSDSSEKVTHGKRKAKSGGRGSASTIPARGEEEEERWHNKEEKDNKPDPLRFMPARTPGLTLDTTTSWTPLSLFRLFFSSTVVHTLIQNTNAHAAKRLQAGLKFKWTPLTATDFWIFLSVILFTSLVSVHHQADYWRKEWPYGFPFPSNTMSRDRFEAILFSLHLSNPTEDDENKKKKNTAKYDRLFKIKPLYTQIVSACQAHFQPFQNICINERMVGSKAHINMKQYMKDKPTKWVYKIFILADAQTAYTFNFFVYQGKSESTAPHGLTFSVWDLLPFETLGRGYTLYVDNYYTSPVLFDELAKKNIGCCGTIRTNQVGYPKSELNNMPKNAERGDMRWLRRGKLLFVKWRDTREVNMCSTIHEAFSGQTVKRRVKEAGVWKVKAVSVPCAVLDYNRFMGGVDLSDALIKYYSVHHKTMKWYKTFFYHFIDIAVVNSFLLHKELCKTKNEKPYTQKVFREKLSKEMLDFGISSAPPQPTAVTCMPVFYDRDERKHCQRCKDAGKKRVKTRVYCRKCQVPLCFVTDKNCFAEWHDASH